MSSNVLASSLQVISVLLSLHCVLADVMLPSDVERCHHGDTACVARTTTNLVHEYASKGYPAASLPILEPFHVSKVVIADGRGGGSLKLKLTFFDVDVLGLSSLTVDNAVGFTKDTTTSKYELSGDYEKLTFRGKYKVEGSILILPIQGDGDAEITFEKPKFSAKFKPSIQTKNGKNYLSVDKLKILLEPQRMTTKLTNLFNGDEALGSHMNQVLNESWMDVWKELQTSVQDSIAEILKSVVNKVFSTVEYEHLYLA